jgi:tRNA pseudouridine55 synthase
MYNGIINIYKEAGFTSHDVVAKLRGILKQKKIGHTGTLDPNAVGVLPVCLGSGTKLCDFLTEKDKEYIAVLRLGMTTDTQDTGGEILSERPVNVSETEVRAAILSFMGIYPQIPPMYSALKVNGKKLYEIARAGQEVERKPRLVEIKELEILKINLPEIDFRVVCSKGTYIRTLCHDIGEKLGCGGVMAALERTRSGDFSRDTALKLLQVEELAHSGRIAEVVLDVDAVFQHLRAVTVSDEYLQLVQNGNRLLPKQITGVIILEEEEIVRVYGEDGVFYALYSHQDGALKPVKMFL